MANIRSTYPTGQSMTTVDMDGKDPLPYLQALLEREAAQKKPVQVFKEPSNTVGMIGRTSRSGVSGPPRERNPDNFEIPWYSQQGAATRPTGLGAQMIPGMAPDPRLLPPNMRPGASQFQDPTMGPSMAGLSPAPASWQEGFFQKYGYWPSPAQGR